MKEVILIKNGELALKGLNRASFESMMAKDIKHRLYKLGAFKVWRSQSTVTVTPQDDSFDMDEAYGRVSKVFGIAGLTRAAVAPKDMDEIYKTTCEYLGEELTLAKTFKVEAKRADKRFPLKSPEICMETGAYILEHFSNLSVDVHNPDITVHIEIREDSAFIHSGIKQGAGGMPAGSNGKAMILISGGIDSPVAAWMMNKRGVELNAVHFLSPPYTGERALQKVETLCEKVAKWGGRIRLYEVQFTEIQEKLRDECREELFTIIMRRLMMQIAEKLAAEHGCKALVTGESIGQVASQTMAAIVATDNAVNMPVFRPLIGMDKEEIVRIARKIDTFETSILPYEDCCTVFTPKHPKTRPTLQEVLDEENKIDWTELLEKAIQTVEIKDFTF